MTATQRTGTLLGGAAIALWLLILRGVTTAGEDDADIGVGLAALLALALSLGGTVVLVVSARTATRGTAALSLSAWVLHQAPIWGHLGFVLPVLGVLSLTAAVVLTVRPGRGAGVSS